MPTYAYPAPATAVSTDTHAKSTSCAYSLPYVPPYVKPPRMAGTSTCATFLRGLSSLTLNASGMLLPATKLLNLGSTD